MTDHLSEDGIPPIDVWTIAGVHGTLTFAVAGDVVLLHTSDELQGIVYLDELFQRRSPGVPTELSKDQLRRFRDLIDQVLGE
jgi:hypothetical protein